MDRDGVSIAIDETEPHCRGEFYYRVYRTLQDAVRKGNTEDFKKALEKHFGEEVSESDIINIRSPSGNSLLHIAAGIENPDILRALLEDFHGKGIVAEANSRGDTALHIAARAGRIRSAKLLLGCGSIVDMVNDAGNTALHEAVKSGVSELTRVLLSRGSTAACPENKESKCPLFLVFGCGRNVAIANDAGNTALFEDGDSELARLFWTGGIRLVGPKNAAIANDAGNAALHEAVKNGDSELIHLLRIGGRRVVCPKNKEGKCPLYLVLGCGRLVPIANDAENTALHEAVENGDSKLTRLLLSRGSRAVCAANEERKCPLFLAVETGNLEILELLMKAMDEKEVPGSWIEGISPVHGAVVHQRLEMLELMSEKKKELFDLTDDQRRTPLHLAACENYVEGVEFLVAKFASSAFKGDDEGYLPIHVACKMGHLATIKELLRHRPDPDDLLTFHEGQNILHVAAKYGRASVVKYILGTPELEKLINGKDKDGNTPLHVATFQWQPKVLLSLTRDNRVDLKLVNNSNSTARDIVDEQLKQIDAPLHQSLARTILVSAGASRSKEKAICLPKGLGPGRDLEPPDLESLRDEVNTRMVVATLVATMTFAAGFSVPGGNNDSEPDAGIATLLNKPMYDFFVICNTVAMYSSIIAVVNLLWTQIKDPWVMIHALKNARLPLLIALATMSGAFMAGVYVTISKRTWIAVVVLIIGVAALFVILSLYIVLFVPLVYNCRLAQIFADYIIAGILISTSVTGGRATRPALQGKSKSEDGATASAPEMADQAIASAREMTDWAAHAMKVYAPRRARASEPVVETHPATSKIGGDDPENLHENTGPPLNMGDEGPLEIRRAEKRALEI